MTNDPNTLSRFSCEILDECVSPNSEVRIFSLFGELRVYLLKYLYEDFQVTAYFDHGSMNTQIDLASSLAGSNAVKRDNKIPSAWKIAYDYTCSKGCRTYGKLRL